MAAPRSSGSGHSTGQCARSGGAGAGRLPEVVVGGVADPRLLAHRRRVAAARRSDAAAGVDRWMQVVRASRSPPGPTAALVVLSRSHGIAVGSTLTDASAAAFTVLPSFACH